MFFLSRGEYVRAVRWPTFFPSARTSQYRSSHTWILSPAISSPTSFRWTPASTALFLGLVGWLLAGLSGIVNATIALDVVVHNTLWIVGHFHHMALLNIGLVIFGATYHFLPELTGRPLWSETAARWHIWLTFFAGTFNSALWIWQGLEGAPRRFSVLPAAFEDLAVAAVPTVIVLALAQILFFLNVFLTLTGPKTRQVEATA